MKTRIAPSRVYRKLTVEELAERIGVSAETLKKWEADEEEPSVEGIVAMAGILDLPVAFLLGQEIEGITTGT